MQDGEGGDDRENGEIVEYVQSVADFPEVEKRPESEEFTRDSRDSLRSRGNYPFLSRYRDLVSR